MPILKEGKPGISYIQQKEDMTCAIIAMLNAKRFYGFDTPTYGDEEFEKLIDIGRARYGSTICHEEVAQAIGVTRKVVAREAAHSHFPFTFGCWPPKMRLHCVLAIGGTKDAWTLVNYRGPFGSVIESIKVKDLEIIDCWDEVKNQDFRQFHQILLTDRP